MRDWLSGGRSSWNGSYDASNSRKPMVLFAIFIFLGGAVLGYVTKAVTTDKGSDLTASAFRSSVVIDPHMEAMRAGDKTPEGAARAVTTFIVGYGTLAQKSDDDIQRVIDTALIEKPDPALRTQLLQTVGNTKDRLFGIGGNTNNVARLVVVPATYQVKKLDENQMEVSVWYISVLAQSNGKKVQSIWATDTVQVRWTDHWHIASYRAQAGPSPLQYSQTGQPSTFEEVARVLDGYTAYRYATATG